MINGIEELFIKTFIDKRYTDRLIYELSSTKKRAYGEGRFAHGAHEIICEKMLVKAGKKITVAEMVDFLREHGKSGLCYTVFGDYKIEGKETDIEEAVKAADYWPGHSAIFAVPNAAIIIEEQFFGPPARYLLTSNKP